MKILGLINIIVILTIIVYSNFKFLKELKDIKINHFKYKLIYFLMSLALPFSIMLLVTLLVTDPYLNNLLGLKIDFKDDASKIIFASIIFPTSMLTNINFAKFYLKRISKTKNEIELIGKE